MNNSNNQWLIYTKNNGIDFDYKTYYNNKGLGLLKTELNYFNGSIISDTRKRHNCYYKCIINLTLF